MLQTFLRRLEKPYNKKSLLNGGFLLLVKMELISLEQLIF